MASVLLTLSLLFLANTASSLRLSPLHHHHPKTQDGESAYPPHLQMHCGAAEYWTRLAPIVRGPRQENGVAAARDDVYIVGGITTIPKNLTAIQSLDWVDVYSTANNSWRSASPVPKPINHANFVSTYSTTNSSTNNGKLYVLGGLVGTHRWEAIPDCFEYTPETDTWKALPPMPADQARGASAFGVSEDGSTIYLAGGLKWLDFHSGAQLSVATVTAYHVFTQRWTVLPDLPEPRDHVGGAVVGDKFYVVGGRMDGVPNVKNQTWALDLRPYDFRGAMNGSRSWEFSWVEKARMPTARGGLATSHLDGIIYTFGGEGDRDVTPNGVYNEVEAYDPKTDTWTRLPNMTHPRHGTNAVAVGCCNYVPGGGIVTGADAVSTNDAFCV